MEILSNEFYPTPIEVIEQMVGFKNLKDKIVLEPSAGSGNIVDYVQSKGAKCIACEINPKLRSIVASKCTVIGDDFLKITPEQVSHIDMIVMNPPFSKAKDHILHAWDIAPDGCEVIALMNADNQRTNSWAYGRLKTVIKDYGNITELGSVFSSSERKTDVRTAKVELYKPVVNESFDFDGFFFDEQEINYGDGLIKHSQIRNIVEFYVRSIKAFQEFDKSATVIESLLKELGVSGTIIDVKIEYNKNSRNIEDFTKDLQKHCWRLVFDELKLNKYITNNVYSDINRFVEQQSKVPFTMKNIGVMLEILLGTRDSVMNKAIVKAVDEFTKYTHGNRYNVEGWKTNAGHMLNKRIIVDNVLQTRSGGFLSTEFSSFSKTTEHADDLLKAICYIRGYNYDDFGCLQQYLYNNDIVPSEKFDWGVWECKGYIKGTLHLKFKDLKDWEAVNRRYAEIKGQVLPDCF